MIVCNGCPKSGTHILTSLLEQAGAKRVHGLIVRRRADQPMEHRKGREAPKPPNRQPLDQLLGLSDRHYIHAHIAAAADPALDRAWLGRSRHLLIVREPRNIAVSWMRQRARETRREPSEAFLIELIEGGMFGRSVVDFCRGFLPWLGDPDTCIVRFERMFDPAGPEWDRINGFIGADTVRITPKAAGAAIGHGPTATGQWSDFRSWWTSAVDAAWRRTGGHELNAAFGYPLASA